MKKAVLQLFSGSVLGKVIGFLREIVLAYFLGTSQVIDSFRIAQAIFLSFINFFNNEILNSGFLPLYIRMKEKNKARSDIFFKSVYFSLTIVSVVISLIVIFFSEYWVGLFAGANLEVNTIASSMVIVIGVGIPFYFQNTLFSYSEMTNNSYIISSVRPSIQSLGIIIGATMCYYLGNSLFLPTGFVCAFFIMSIISFFLVRKKNFFRITKDWDSSIAKDSMKKLLTIVSPLFIVFAINLIKIIIERRLASEAGVGSVAALEYSRSIVETLGSLVSIPLGLASLTTLSKLEMNLVREKVIPIIELILLFLAPFSVLLFLNSEYLVSIIFERGQFGASSVKVTSTILMGYSLGVWFKVLAVFLVKVLNSQSHNLFVLKALSAGLFLQIIIDLVFTPIYGVIVLGIGEAVSSCVYGSIILANYKFYKKETITTFACILFASSVVSLCHFNLILNDFIHLIVDILLFSFILLLFSGPRNMVLNFLKKFRKL